MKVLSPRTDFVIVEDYFSPLQAAQWLSFVEFLGAHPFRGFHHPDLKPNRFHKAPKYPVKKFMCLGLYWNPLDYRYHETIPFELKNFSYNVLKVFFPWVNYHPDSVLVNYYTESSSMGLHVDKDEEDKISPVIGLNFGSTCRFFFEDENGQMKDIRIPGNSLYIFGGKARLMRHELGSIYAQTLSPGSEDYLGKKERINLTIRQVYRSAGA